MQLLNRRQRSSCEVRDATALNLEQLEYRLMLSVTWSKQTSLFAFERLANAGDSFGAYETISRDSRNMGARPVNNGIRFECRLNHHRRL
jgi:hypothetical protein